MGEMEKAWKPQEVERELYRSWEKAGLFVADPHSPKPHFSMVLPPPNITGELHLGHAVNHSLQDVYSRYKRLRGFEVLWLPGTDHAGWWCKCGIRPRKARPPRLPRTSVMPTR